MKDWDAFYKNHVVESDYKVILIILDGMPDIYVKELGGTPLSAANKPNLDKLAQDGASGIIYPTIEPHIAVGSGIAHFALLGYELDRYPGRGPLEGLGADLNIPVGAVVIRLNFATIENGIITDRRAGRLSGNEAKALFERLINLKCDNSWGLKYEIHHTKGYRGIMIITGKNASASVTDSDPEDSERTILKVSPISNDKKAKITADFLNWFIQASQKELASNNTKANAIISRGAGVIQAYESFTNRYKFKNPVFVSSYPLYKGVAKFLGIPVQEPQKTGAELTIRDKFQTASELIKDHDIVILHIKDPDIAGEDGDYLKKKEIIEEIDACLPYILDNMGPDDTIIVTSDHSTPALMREHSGHSIPIVMKGPFVRVDKVEQFSELDCITGSLGTFRAIELMNLILMSTKRLKTFQP
jgi:2,3-bisphosphoglycerate-independent phosphoglycerate mutase